MLGLFVSGNVHVKFEICGSWESGCNLDVGFVW